MSPSPNHEAIAYERARLGFFRHLVIFAVVACSLVLLNIAIDPAYRWFIWPTLAWGTALAAHALYVFARPHPALHARVADSPWDDIWDGV